MARSAMELKAKFADLKSRVKKKCGEIDQHQKATGGAAPKKLNENEEMVINLAGQNAIHGIELFHDVFQATLTGETAAPDDTSPDVMPLSDVVCNTPKRYGHQLPNIETQTASLKKKENRVKNSKTAKVEDFDQELLQISKEKLALSERKLQLAEIAIAVQKETNLLLKQLIDKCA